VFCGISLFEQNRKENKSFSFHISVNKHDGKKKKAHVLICRIYSPNNCHYPLVHFYYLSFLLDQLNSFTNILIIRFIFINNNKNKKLSKKIFLDIFVTCYLNVTLLKYKKYKIKTTLFLHFIII